VKPGEFFSTSAYAQFGNDESHRGLHQYIGEDILIKCTGTIKVDQPSPMFVYTLHVSKETKARLLATRQRILNHQLPVGIKKDAVAST
jgi:hypothetical protein